jgi:hypothetical protein
MADTPNPNTDVNHSLDRRREEKNVKNVENIVQDSISRMTELTSSQMEVWQKQLALGSQIANYWSDTFNIAQQSFGRMIENAQQQQHRR